MLGRLTWDKDSSNVGGMVLASSSCTWTQLACARVLTVASRAVEAVSCDCEENAAELGGRPDSMSMKDVLHALAGTLVAGRGVGRRELCIVGIDV